MVGETYVSGGGFERLRDVLHTRYEHFKGYMKAEDFELINSLVDCIPDSDTLIHGDLHPGNIMLQGDELMLIDMAELTTGASGYEMLRIYYAMCGTAGNERFAKAAENSIGMPRNAITKFWNSFIRRYLGTDDDKKIEKFMKEMALKNVINDTNTLAKVPAERLKQYMAVYKEQSIEGVIRPNEQELRRLLAEM
jgi:5-methylthioribose kinase